MAVEREKSPYHRSHIRDGNIGSSVTITSNFADITQVLFFDILIRLPIKSIVLCKSVCKDWYKMISDPEFTKFYSTQGKHQFLIRGNIISTALYLVEHDQISHVFDLDKFIWKKENTRIRIPPSMKIPLNNADLGQDIDQELYDSKQMLKVVNSCHGLLCLSEPMCNAPVAVCNPLTSEYINLPKPLHQVGHFDSGLGFSPKSNAYKVIRVHSCGTMRLYNEHKTYSDTYAEVLTLGTASWRRLVSEPPNSITQLAFPTYHDGALYCLYVGDTLSIVSFDLDDEKFMPVPLPQGCLFEVRITNLSIFRGDLCLSGRNFISSCFEVWAMKNNNSSGKSWTKLLFSSIVRKCWLHGSQPIDYFDNGVLLIYCYSNTKLIYLNRDGSSRRHFFMNDHKTIYEVIVYTPSFVSLKDILVTDHVEVLNINSRYEKLKMPGETQALILNPIFTEAMNNLDLDDFDYWIKQHWMKQ